MTAAKFQLNLEDDFDFIKKKKGEQTAKSAVEPAAIVDNVDIHNLNTHEPNIQKLNIHNPNIHKPNTNNPARRREPQSVAALRQSLYEKLAGRDEIVVKMTEIAREIGFSTAWMQFAMKCLAENNEFVFTRYAEGKLRGTRVVAARPETARE